MTIKKGTKKRISGLQRKSGFSLPQGDHSPLWSAKQKAAHKFTLSSLFAVVLFIMLLSSHSLMAQKTVNYYRVDKVISVRGEIIDIKNEPCSTKEDFTVIYLKEEKSSNIYRVEVSPRWFFTLEIMIGSRIELTGSAYTVNDTQVILARSMMYQGELHQFRDQYGFPLWRGKAKGKGMNRNRMGREGMKRRGHS